MEKLCPKPLPSPTPPPPPHSPTYLSLLSAGTRLKSLQQVHAHMIVTAQHHNRALLTKLIVLSCTAGAVIYSRQLFASIRNPDAFSFISLIRVSAKSGFSRDAILFYNQMLLTQFQPTNFAFTSTIKACADLAALQIGRAIHSHVLANGLGLDTFVQTALVSFYSKCGDLGAARKVFDTMPERSIVAWNALISGYEQNGFASQAVVIFNLMQRARIEPDSATLVSVLSACSQLGASNLGERIHDHIVSHSFPINVILGTSLVSMYARCGNVYKARQVFDEMPERNVVAWTAMISAYGMHGYGFEALDLFGLMTEGSGPRPNDVTLVAVLSACAHAGFVSAGREIFLSMKQDYGLAPRVEHHVCMVDLLGRAGLLNEAARFIESIPSEPGPAVWTAMLGACKMHKNFDLGVDVAEHLLAIEPDNSGHYVLLSNLYALAGKTDRVEMVRSMMRSRGLKKQIGFSSIEIDGVSHVFCMGDTSHPQMAEIHLALGELISKLREIGYVPETDTVLHELEGEEREFALRFHSEKLAVTYGLIHSSYGIPIKIVKNLRICGDCHLVMKFISIVASKEIIIRDKHRFHHFKEGSCSCKDYW